MKGNGDVSSGDNGLDEKKGRIRSLLSHPLIPVTMILIGALLMVAFLSREELHRRGLMGLHEGIFLPLSAPYIGAMLILAGILLASNRILQGRMRKVALPVMIVGFLIAAFGLFAAVAFYYSSFVNAVHLFSGFVPSASERYIMAGLIVFSAGFAVLLWDLMNRPRTSDSG